MNYALVIGINHYTEMPLSAAVSDARNFAQWLKDSKLVEDPNLYLLTSDTANSLAMNTDIDRSITSIVAAARKLAGEKHRLYFYFSGHGIGVSFSQTALCLRQWCTDLPNYCISSMQYKDGLVNVGVFDEIIMFLDCCRNADLLIDTLIPGFQWKLPVGVKSTSVAAFYGTKYGNVSYEITSDPDNMRGAFTSFLLESLRGDAAEQGQTVIKAKDLKKHISDNFESYAQKLQRKQIAATEFAGNAPDEMVICPVAPKQEAFNYLITFTRSAEVSLIDGFLNPVKFGKVIKGDNWQLNLPRGIFILKDTAKGEEKYITNYSNNTITHEQF